jgi:uncharacterized protein (TIGR03066 family)
MIRSLLLAVTFFVTLGLTVAQDKKDPVKDTEKLLLGKWKLKKSDDPLPPGLEGIIEFKADGKLSLVIKFEGMTQNVSGTWKLLKEGKEIDVSLKEEGPNGKEKKEVLKIEKLDEKNFITVDEKKKKDEFERHIEK